MGRRVRSWSPGGTHFYGLVHTYPEAHPASCTMGTGGKEAGARCCPPTPFYRQGPERIELYFCLPSVLCVCLASNVSAKTCLTHILKCYQPYWLHTLSGGCFLLDHTCDDLPHYLCRAKCEQYSAFMHIVHTRSGGLGISWSKLNRR